MKDDFENLVEFEKKKHNDFFLPYYKEKGWEVLQDNIGVNADWDVKLRIDGKDWRIDEKARQKDYGDFLVEIVQDLKTGNRGWLFKEKDMYFYASWNNQDLLPTTFYVVYSKKLQNFVITNWKNLLPNIEISIKGWGVTLFAKLKWEDLIFTNIAK